MGRLPLKGAIAGAHIRFGKPREQQGDAHSQRGCQPNVFDSMSIAHGALREEINAFDA
jgi:hypothetical protein